MEPDIPVLKRVSKRTIDNEATNPQGKIERQSMLNLNSGIGLRNSKKLNPYDFLIISTAGKNLSKDLGSKSKQTPNRIKGIANPVSLNTTNRIENKGVTKEGNQSFYLTMLEKYQILNQSKTPKGLKCLFPALEGVDDALKNKHEGGSPSPSNSKAKVVPNESKKSFALKETSKFVGKPECVPVINGSSKSPNKQKSDQLVKINEECSRIKSSINEPIAERSVGIKSSEAVLQKSQSQEIKHSITQKSKNSHKKGGGFRFLCCF